MHRKPLMTRSGVNVNAAERWGSVLIGLALLGWGLARRSLVGVGAAGAGALLFERGASGRCPVYGRLGLSSR